MKISLRRRQALITSVLVSVNDPLVLLFKKCCKLFWQTTKFLLFCILAESGRGRWSVAEKADGSSGTIVPFVTSDDPRRAYETCWLLDV